MNLKLLEAGEAGQDRLAQVQMQGSSSECRVRNTSAHPQSPLSSPLTGRGLRFTLNPWELWRQWRSGGGWWVGLGPTPTCQACQSWVPGHLAGNNLASI